MSEHKFSSDRQIAELVRRFEACEIQPAEFKHYQHLTVAAWYIARLPYDEASEKMKTGIKRLAAAYGKTGYHETITEFWLRQVRGFLERESAHFFVTANQLIEKYDRKNLIFEYYSEELLSSAEAKEAWVEPDLKPIEVN